MNCPIRHEAVKGKGRRLPIIPPGSLLQEAIGGGKKFRGGKE